MFGGEFVGFIGGVKDEVVVCDLIVELFVDVVFGIVGVVCEFV